jgi:hemolysin III
MNQSADYLSSEERAHCLAHGAGIVASLVAIPWLVWTAVHYGDPWRLASGVIFGLSSLLLFTTSVLYHSSRDPRRRLMLRRFDHSAIYVLIAGTYTPFALGLMRGNWGWTLFAAVWTLALLGIAAKTTNLGFRFHKTSVVLYLLMGWLIVAFAGPAMRSMSSHEWTWLVIGGLLYTIGVPFYMWKRQRYSHAVWHVFVLAGVVSHFVAILSVMDAR